LKTAGDLWDLRVYLPIPTKKDAIKNTIKPLVLRRETPRISFDTENAGRTVVETWVFIP
jgi:hypothetical protein